MNKNNGIGINYLFNLIYQVTIVAIPLITTPYLSRVLGADNIGIYSYTYSIVSVFLIFATFGTAVFAQREFAIYKGDMKSTSRLFFEIFTLRSILSIICAIAYFFLAINEKNKIVAIVQIGFILQNIIDVSWFLQAEEKFFDVMVGTLCSKIICLVLIFVLVRNDGDLLKYVYILVATPIVSNAYCWLRVRKEILWDVDRIISPFAHFKDIVLLFAPCIATQIYTYFDKIMLGMSTIDNVENGYYEQAMGMTRSLLIVVTSATAVTVPKVSGEFSKGNNKAVIEYIKNNIRFVWAVSMFLIVGIVGTADFIVPIYLGSDYMRVSYILKASSPIIVAIGMSNVIGLQYLVSIKKQNIYTISVFIGAIINFTLNLFFIPKWYAIGAVISSVVAEFTITMVQVVYVVGISKTISLNAIFMSGRIYLSLGIILLGLYYFIYPITGRLLATIIICISYVLMLCLYKDDVVSSLLMLGKRIVKRGEQ